MMIVPIGVLQAALFDLEVFGMVGPDRRLYPCANFKVKAPMVQVFEGRVVVLEPRQGLFLDGAKLGYSVHLFGDSDREFVGRWLRDMTDSESLVPPDWWHVTVAEYEAN